MTIHFKFLYWKFCRSIADVETPTIQNEIPKASQFQATKKMLSISRPSDTQLYQSFFIVRHGHRLDEEDPSWYQEAERPWDPPLSQQGRTEARLAADRFKDWKIDIVICSPFLRCLQTSAEIVARLKIPASSWIVTWPLAEVCSTEYLLGDEAELLAKYKRKPIESWMWGGKSIAEAVSEFAAGERIITGLKGTPVIWDGPAPGWPEKMETGEKRFVKSVKTIAAEFPDKTVLIVTHGDALKAVLCEHVERAEVLQVRHLAYLPLVRQAFQGRWGPWHIGGESGSTGVDWAVKKAIAV